MALPQVARAETAGEWQARGYLVRLTSRVAGAFNGCRPKQQVRLEHGSSIACDTVIRQYGFAPEVIVLQDPVTLDGVLLIHGVSYQGTVVVAEGAGRIVKIKVGVGPLIDALVADSARLPGFGAISQSIGDNGAAEALPPPTPIQPHLAGFEPVVARRR